MMLVRIALRAALIGVALWAGYHVAHEIEQRMQRIATETACRSLVEAKLVRTCMLTKEDPQ